ncbi:transporter substrate-binding domain-containing protein [bacterium]|nr:transporter substrate-binding domain-containing protein [bacterium]
MALALLFGGCGDRIDDGFPSATDRQPAIAHPALEHDLGAIHGGGVLRILTRYNATNYFIHKGGQAGFDYELALHFAREHDLTLEVEVVDDDADLVSLLNAGRGDLVCAGLTPDGDLGRWTTATRPTNFVRKVLVVAEDSPIDDDPASLNRMTVTVPAGEPNREALLAYRREHRLHFFVTAGRPGADPEELLADVAAGRSDAVVVDDIVARATMKHLPGLRIGPVLGPRQPTVWYLRENCPDLRAAVNEFLRRHIWMSADGEPLRSRTYGIIYDRYFENPLTIRGFREAANRPDLSGAISPYDDLIRRKAEEAGFDWRLIAAQIYQESRFYPFARSRANARGLMQVLPRFGGAQGDSLYEPEANLTAGLRLMRATWLSYAYLDSLDRLRFTLAEYHAGHGHVTDARRIAMEMGRNPNRWEGSLAVTLPRLMERRHFSRARHGYYGGAETVSYVEEILNRYRSYMRLVPRTPETPPDVPPDGPPTESGPVDVTAVPELAIPPEPR